MVKTVDPLFYTAEGNLSIEQPRPGETIDQLYKRLHRLARNYRRWSRAFRVEKVDDGVLWWRVAPGEHTKLAWWYRLPVDHPFVMKRGATEADLKAAKATARYLRRKRKGAFGVSLEGEDLVVTRKAAAE